MGTTPCRTSIDAPPHILDLLTRLHERSDAEEAALKSPDGGYTAIRSASPGSRTRLADEVMKDKFVALEADKAAFMYQLVRATGASNVVEAGSSYGVSTIYLALAVGQNATAAGKKAGEARVVATEHESAKAARAREYWREAGEGVEEWIELREGDLRETLKEGLGEVDFVLMDIWTPMALPTLEVLETKLKPGAVILVDNTIASAAGYEDFLQKIRAPDSKYKSLTLPFDGGLEMVTFLP